MVQIPVLENHGSNVKGYQSGPIGFHPKSESEKLQKCFSFEKGSIVSDTKKPHPTKPHKKTPKNPKAKKAEVEKSG